MYFTDFATRAYNHSFHVDPIVRSLLDTDFYKFLMLQLIWQKHKDVPVTFAVTNRTKSVRLADDIPYPMLKEQLDHARTVRFSRNELIWLQGNTFYGRKGIFEPEFIQWLASYQLPEYSLERLDGQYKLEFADGWANVSPWEIHALTIINELRSRVALKQFSRLELDVIYARAKAKLWDKLQRLNQLENLNLTDFATRRRHGHLWQQWAIQAAADALGAKFTGTSNAYFAMQLGLEAKGTNAHELPMVYAAMADGNQELAASPYRVLEDWQELYDGALRIMLPDTFGTTGFLERAPDWAAGWTGARIDSKDPFEGAAELIDWWSERGQNPAEKLIIFADGLDVGPIEELHHAYNDTARIGFGWGTTFANDFRGCLPNGGHDLDPISIVCKVAKAAGRSAVKLSDNIQKATGAPAEIERYLSVFGRHGFGDRKLVV